MRAVVLLSAVVALTAVAATGHEHAGHAHGGTSEATKAKKFTGEKKSLYVAIRVHGECAAELGEVHEVKAYPTDNFHPIADADMNGGAKVESVCPFDHIQFGTSGVHPEYRGMTWLVAYRDPATGARMGHVFLDPRIRVGESRFGQAPSTVDGSNDDDVRLHHQSTTGDGTIPMINHVHHHPDIHFVRVPIGVKSVDLMCRNTSAVMSLTLRENQHAPLKVQTRAFGAKTGTATGIQFEAIQATGPVDTQTNIIFLSSGFTVNQKPIFDVAVQRIQRGMNPTQSSGSGFDEMHATVPFDRYWPFYNVFSVFQPSNEAGATRAAIGVSVDNNLRCYHPSTLERAISCNIELSMALASVTPAPVKEDPDRCIVVVIVNTNLYGGSALYRRGSLHLGHFYRGFTGSMTSTDVTVTDSAYDELKFNSLVKHELGHAFGNLFDEYDIGITEPTSQPLLNCESPQDVNGRLKWQDWITIRNNASWSQYSVSAEPDFNVQNTPLSICGYSNYFKPNDRCMMQAVRDYFMCPVCREECTKTILDPVLSYAWPRIPREDAVLVILRSDGNVDNKGTSTRVAHIGGAVVYLPAAVSPANGFSVTWKWNLPGGLQTYQITPDVGSANAARVASLPLTAARLNGIPDGQVVVFNATITDNTNFMTIKTRGQLGNILTQTHSFFVRVETSITIAGNYSVIEVAGATSSLPVGRIVNNEFPVVEECNSASCNIAFSSSPYQEPTTAEEFIGEFDQWVLYMQGGLALLFLGLWVWAYSYYKGKSDQVVRPIFRTQFTGIVKIVRLIMTISAVCFMLSALAALGISGYYYTQTSALGKIIIIAGTVLSFGLYVMAFIGFWAISYRSKKLVIINGAVLYTGLTALVICNALAISVGSQITDRKSYWNQNLETFWVELVKYNSERACAVQGMLKCSGFYIACNTIVQSTEHCPRDCELNNRKFGTSCQILISEYISDNYDAVIRVIGACVVLMFLGLLFNFIYFVGLAKMKRDISKENDKRVHRAASKNGSSMKKADKSKALMILASLDTGDMQGLMREFARIDVDGNGELDRAEFFQFFKKALCYKPSEAEIDEIYRVADLDGDGTISMEEFLCLFDKTGTASVPIPKGKGGKASRLRRTLDPAREQELRRRAAKVFGDDVAPHADQQMAEKKPAYRPTQQRPPDHPNPHHKPALQAPPQHAAVNVGPPPTTQHVAPLGQAPPTHEQQQFERSGDPRDLL